MPFHPLRGCHIRLARVCGTSNRAVVPVCQHPLLDKRRRGLAHCERRRGLAHCERRRGLSHRGALNLLKPLERPSDAATQAARDASKARVGGGRREDGGGGRMDRGQASRKTKD